MTDPIALYTNGLSVRQTAASLGMDYTKVRRIIDSAGVTRNPSEAQCVKVNSQELVLNIGNPEKPWAVIRSPYLRPQWFSNIDFKGRR